MTSNIEWDELTAFLDEKVASLSETSSFWQTSWASEGDAKVLVQNFKAAEQPLVDAIEEAIEAWCDTGLSEWPRMSESVQSLIKLRLQTGAVFTNLHTVGAKENPSSAVPFPSLPDAEFLRWLMMEWWDHHGRQLACEVWILQQLRLEGA
jgi:hypothetical protein